MSFDDGWEVRSVFLDISKAFDKVWHEGLLLKLKLKGISGNLLKSWKTFYLQERVQGKIFLPDMWLISICFWDEVV